MSDSGVYEIKNVVNGNIYIGSSKNIQKRIKTHIRLLNKNQHHSHHLQMAWNKYGQENFVFSTIAECEIADLIKIEQEFIDLLKPEYNISPTAGRTSGIIRSEEYRQKQSISQKGKVLTEETKNKISAGMMGKRNSLGVTHICSDDMKIEISKKLMGHTVSEETRSKISSKNKGYKHTEEAKRKIGQSSLGNKYASRKQTPEEIEKRKAAIKKHWENKKNDGSNYK